MAYLAIISSVVVIALFFVCFCTLYCCCCISHQHPEDQQHNQQQDEKVKEQVMCQQLFTRVDQKEVDEEQHSNHLYNCDDDQNQAPSSAACFSDEIFEGIDGHE